MINALLKLWRAEPIGVTAVVTTGIDLAIATGAPIDEPVKIAFLAFFGAVGFLVARQQVTPNLTVARKVKAARTKKAMPKG